MLAELLWGDKPDDVANANLRMALSNLRKLVGPCLDITRSDVAIARGCRYEVDVQHFQTRLSQVDLATLESNCTLLEEAMSLYRGDFLEGLPVRVPRALRNGPCASGSATVRWPCKGSIACP